MQPIQTANVASLSNYKAYDTRSDMSHTTCLIRQNMRMSDRVAPHKAYDTQSDLSQPTCRMRQNLRMSDRV